jgi:hypothetical protein
MEILLAMRERMNADHKEIMAWLTDRNDNREETMALPRKYGGTS